jgi:hypothetical protein
MPGTGGQWFRTHIHFDAGSDPVSPQKLDEGCAILQMLTDGFVVEDHSADATPSSANWRAA